MDWMRRPVLALLGTAMLSGTPRRAEGCCVAFPEGFEVEIAAQEILVLWDAERGIEHFVRRADFRRDGAAGLAESGDTPGDFGFLVPTPSVPIITETEGEAFDRLQEVTRPVIERPVEWSISAGLWLLIPNLGAERALTAEAPADDARAGGVEVLAQLSVAGYEASVLAADDVDALARWLDDHGFDDRPALREWLEPYVELGWKLTAFAYDPTTDRSRIEAGSICMSFETDRPLFPYRVPSDNRRGGSLLRAYVVASERVDADLGPSGTPWEARTTYADRRRDLGSLLDRVAPDGAVPEEAWLTAFEDRRWPGGSEDLFFRPADDPSPYQRRIVRPIRRELLIPLDAIALGLIALVAYRAYRRRRTADPAR